MGTVNLLDRGRDGERLGRRARGYAPAATPVTSVQQVDGADALDRRNRQTPTHQLNDQAPDQLRLLRTFTNQTEGVLSALTPTGIA